MSDTFFGDKVLCSGSLSHVKIVLYDSFRETSDLHHRNRTSHPYICLTFFAVYVLLGDWRFWFLVIGAPYHTTDNSTLNTSKYAGAKTLFFGSESCRQAVWSSRYVRTWDGITLDPI